eukprot:GCRY01003415.1.p1 GENE.GCRY01003415.1~~GCRY01003415.1.p1  ORF type:complete len:399 (+),score=84.36 GCRY01003415.1:124-1320(+)
MKNTITIECPTPRENDLLPFVGQFPKGKPCAKLNFHTFRGADSRRRRQRTIACGDQNVYYTANNKQPSCTKYLIGVYDRSAKKLKIADCGSMFSFDQNLTSLNNAVTSAGLDKMSYFEQKKELIKTFGSRKKILQVKGSEASAIHSDQLVGGEEMENVLAKKGEKTKTLDEMAKMVASNRQTPYCHEDAQTPSLLYPLEELIAAEDMEEIHGLCKPMLKLVQKPATLKQMEENKEYPPFILNRFKNIALGTMDKQTKFKTMQILLYLNYLLAYHKMIARDVYDLEKVKDAVKAPEGVCQRMMDFFTKTGRASKKPYRTKATQTLLESYCCALGLHLDDFSADPQEYGLMFGLPVTKAQMHFLALGCVRSTKKNDDERVVRYVLNTPPTFTSKVATRRG